MFTQFRQVVENFAPQPRRGSDAGVGDEHREFPSRSNSLDSHGRPSSPLSSSQLAESARLNLRKSLATQRAGGSILGQKSASTHPLNTSPDVSVRALRSPKITATECPPSPSSIPLPISPPLSPIILTTVPISPLVEAIDITTTPLPEQESQQLTTENEPQDLPSTPALCEGTEISEMSVGITQIVESPEIIQILETQPASTPHSSSGTGVESLQERLKQIEQRFTDVSTSFKRLQAEKAAADAVLHELTPLQGIQDGESLRKYLQNLFL
ncbi:hypothetical protein BDZ94DRAFT_875978 [Collybia nuda]|uniref:Uncharacterized protein n=1 Tax=Collybia nuda TaxID=64659 RepID=A0A9P5Y048_9AGAR|nr:hypothetical protein BDZ94DRAFT_875978 [Collybia nuda]